MRRVMVRVLPVPAPASTHTGPRGASTASRCSSSRRSSRALATGMVPIMAGDADNSGVGIADRSPWLDQGMTAKLTMYTTPWFGYCFRLKTALKSAGISFIEVDIEQDPAAAEFV